jgi:hydroxymethylpyrimidine/phosphomethylpyrimidine kinase
MLALAEIIDLVADRAEGGRLPPLVVDPVMVASSGDRLLDEHAEAAYREHLFPHAFVITPNLREASVLVDREVSTVGDMTRAAAELADEGPDWVIVKGGHLEGDAIDVVHERRTGSVFELVASRTDSRNVHGTGCSFAAAIAGGLAQGHEPQDAIRAAKAAVTRAIMGAAEWRLGAGHGPIDHFGWTAAPPSSTTSPTPGTGPTIGPSRPTARPSTRSAITPHTQEQP